MPFYVVRDSEGHEVSRYASTSPQVGAWPVDHTHTEFDPEQPVPEGAGNRRLTKLAFVARLGGNFATILAAAKVNVQVELFVKMLDWATPEADGTSVDLDDPRVIDALNALEQAGLIAPGSAEEILNAE
jgi:hypothetical protein